MPIWDVTARAVDEAFVDAWVSRCEVPTRNTTYLLVLLGLSGTLKPGIHATSAQLVFGTTLRLPGDFVTKNAETTTAGENDLGTRDAATATNGGSQSSSQSDALYLFAHI